MCGTYYIIVDITQQNSHKNRFATGSFALPSVRGYIKKITSLNTVVDLTISLVSTLLQYVQSILGIA